MCARLPSTTMCLGEAIVWSRTALVAVALILLARCSSVPIPPTYTQEELKAICQRHTGYWQPDGPAGGFCEFRGP